VKLGPRSSLGDVAFAVGHALRLAGIEAVLTGGACANLYTLGRHASADADFVLGAAASPRAVEAAMRSVGFVRRGDHWFHPVVRFYVEFPRGPLAIGRDHRLRPVVRERRGAKTLSLSPTDSCRDRLAAFYHWGDRQALGVAVRIALLHRVRHGVIRDWSLREDAAAGWEEFRAALRSARRSRR
jgi:hypothetical protein